MAVTMTTSSITGREAATYTQMWTDVEAYSDDAGPGARYLETFGQYATPGARVLDAGCGHGKVAVSLSEAGYLVTCCDLTDAGLVPAARALTFIPASLWRGVSGTWDWGWCIDVLEHLPTQFTMLAVARLLEVCRDGVFLVISLMPDEMGVWVGRPLHLTTQPYGWWKDSLEEIGEVVDARDLMSHALFVVRRRW